MKKISFIPSFMNRKKQLSFVDQRMQMVSAFGATLLRKAKNRHARPLCTKRSIHLILRSSRAIGVWSLVNPKNRKIVTSEIRRWSKLYGIRIYQIGIVGNHIHLILRLSNRFTYSSFIRSLTGGIAIKVTGANKFRPLKKKFWDFRPFSRIIEWGRAYRIARDYALLNHLEGLGVIPYQKGRLPAFWSKFDFSSA